MEKIYAVTKGSYSAYHIIALTTDKERAEHIAKIFSDGWDDAEVEEFEDSKCGESGMIYTYHSRCDFVELDDYCQNEEEGVHEYKDGVYTVYVFASDKECAKKKALDMIAEYKEKDLGL